MELGVPFAQYVSTESWKRRVMVTNPKRKKEVETLNPTAPSAKVVRIY